MMVQQGLEQHTAAFRVQQNQMYSDIDAAVQEHVVQTPVQQVTGAGFHQQVKTVMKETLEGPAMPSTAGMKEFAGKQMALLKQQEKILNPNLLAKSREMLQTIIDSPPNVTFKAMSATRSDLLGLTRQLDDALGGKQLGFAKKLAGLADESMMGAADKSGIPGLPDQIRAANKLTADTHAIYEQALVKKVVETKKPEAIASLISGKSVGLEETRDLFKVLPKEIHPAVQRQVLVDTMRQSSNILTKNFNERKFAEKIASMGDERGSVIFGDNWKNIRELSGLMERINGPVGLGGGSGAALQNAGLIKGIISGVGTTVPTVLAATGHADQALKVAAIEGVSFLGVAVTYRALASALTNPEATVKLLKVARGAVRATPYAATGAVEVGRGQTKATRDLKAIRDKHTAQMQPTQPTQ
jgi:hypothetical protein